MKIEKLNSNSSPKIHNILDKNIVSFSSRKNIDKFDISEEEKKRKDFYTKKRFIPNIVGLYDAYNSEWEYIAEVQYYPEDIKKLKKMMLHLDRIFYCQDLIEENKFIIDDEAKEKIKKLQEKNKDAKFGLAPTPASITLWERIYNIYLDVNETIRFLRQKEEYVDVNGEKILKRHIPNWAGGWKGEEDEGWRYVGKKEFYPEDLKKMETMTAEEIRAYREKLLAEKKYIFIPNPDYTEK